MHFSVYISHTEQEPAYLKYIDEHFNYRKEFSGKSISDAGITKLIELQEKAKKSAFKGKFGLGMIQWTEGHTSGLLDSYKKYCKYKNIAIWKTIIRQHSMLSYNCYK